MVDPIFAKFFKTIYEFKPKHNFLFKSNYLIVPSWTQEIICLTKITLPLSMFQMDASFRKRHIDHDNDKILNAQTNHTCEKHRMLLDDVRIDIKNDTLIM